MMLTKVNAKKLLNGFIVLFMMSSLCFLLSTSLEYSKAYASTYTVENWRMVEIPLTSTVTYTNPFLDVSITATFTGPNGEVITRPGFWDGGLSWKVRFAPTAVGAWSYTITSSDTTNTGLHNHSGTITCSAYTGTLDIYKHGFLRKSDDSRHLANADGTPFFWLGDTHWSFEKESFDTSNSNEFTSEFKGMVDKRVAQKFTVYQSTTYSPNISTWAPNKAGEEINPDYFKNVLDPRMQYIADKGLVNAFGLGFHSNIDDFVTGTTRLAKYIVARYGAYPMAWITSGEGAGYEPGMRQNRLNGWRQVAQEIDAYDSYNQPQTAHYIVPFPTFYQGESWFDFTMVQGGHTTTVPATKDYLNYYNTYTTTPLVEGESNYEQIYSGGITDAIVRKSAYRAIQSGSFGYTYGANGIWNATWDPSVSNDTFWGNTNWYDAIDFAGGTQMTYLKNFYSSMLWYNLTPKDSSWATWNLSLSDQKMPVESADKLVDSVVVFFPNDYNTTGNAGTLKNLQNATYTGKWYNPRSDVYTTISSTINPVSGQWTVPQKPDSSDWLLWLQRNGSLGDTTAPSAITNLSVSMSPDHATLTWTAPGDDTSTGTAFTYDIRYSTSPITTANWASATKVAIAPSPATAGTSESFSVTDLVPSTLYYFAMKTSDEVPNVSGLSNVTSATTTADLDTTAPAAVTDLTVYSTTATATRLEWTAPGDDGNSGKATTYDIRYSASTITDANWASATQVTLEPIPGVAGTKPSFLVEDLMSGKSYYFAIKTIDNANNVSGLSNVVNGVTTGGINLALNKTYSASSYYPAQPPSNAFDGNLNTPWACSGFAGNWLEVDFGANTTFDHVTLTEYGTRTTGYRIEYWDGSAWQTAYTGTNIGFPNTPAPTPRTVYFTEVTGSKARIYFTSGSSTPIIYEFEVYKFNYGPEDNVAPSKISSLTYNYRTGTTTKLTWSAPGDDNGVGTASAYDIRYSTSSITDANWASATQATGEPAPLAAGTKQSYVVTGLSPNTTYYFAIKTLDEAGNISKLSSVSNPSITTRSDNLALGKTYSSSSIYDATVPAPNAFDVNTISAWQAAPGPFNGDWLEVDFGAATTFNSVQLTEYGNRTSGYRIEYWDGSTWLTAYTGTTIGDNATPKAVSFSAVTGSKARIYFTSGIYTPIIYEFEIYNDLMLPSAVTDLTTVVVKDTSLKLRWTVPGDDVNTAGANMYDIRYSTAAITDANWSSATQVTGEPIPGTPRTGFVQNYTVTGLNPSTTYYFAIRTSDGAGNVSGLSNIPSVSTVSNTVCGLWHLDEGSGNITADSSGNSNIGNLVNGALWTSGKTNNAVQLDGIDDYVNVPDNSTLNGMSAITVAAWVNISQLPSAGQNYDIVGKDSNGNSYRITLGASGTGHFVVNTSNNSWYSAGTYAGFTTVLSTNTWYYIVGTYDGSNVRVYVNGSYEGSGSQTISGTINNSLSNVKFGYKSSSNVDYLKGTVDEVNVYNRALTSDEVKNLYLSY